MTTFTDFVDNIPLLRLTAYMKTYKLKTDLLARINSFNPGGGITDRIRTSIIEYAEHAGLINKGNVLVEPVFKTGVGLAWMACLKGYKLILAIPDTVSKQHISLLKSWGAIIALTPGSKGVEGAVEKAKQLKDEISGAVILEQIAGHIVSKMSNAWDIWEYNDKIIDIFVTVDSAISHFAGLLKTKNPAIKIIGAETPEYPITENRDIVDEIVSIQNDDALKTVKELAVLEGLTVGILSGMTVAVATIISKREENFGKTILSILPDPDGCYISTILNI